MKCELVICNFSYLVLPKYEVKVEMRRPFHVLEFGDITANIIAKYVPAIL